LQKHSNFNDGNALEIPKATSIPPNVLATPPTIENIPNTKRGDKLELRVSFHEVVIRITLIM